MEHLDFLVLEAWGVGLRTALEERTSQRLAAVQERREKSRSQGRITNDRWEQKGCKKKAEKVHKSWVRQVLPNSLVKDTLEISLRQSRALNVLVDDLVRLVDLLDVVQHVLVSDRLHVLLGQGSAGVRVVSKIDLGANQDDGGSGRVMSDLRKPLFKELISPIFADKSRQRASLTFAATLSYDGGLTTEKQMRKTSVWG